MELFYSVLGNNIFLKVALLWSGNRNCPDARVPASWVDLPHPTSPVAWTTPLGRAARWAAGPLRDLLSPSQLPSLSCPHLLRCHLPALCSGSPKATSASFWGREHSPCSLQRRGPCLSSTSSAPTPTGGRWTQRAAMLRGLPILPAQPRSWTLPALAWQEGICGPRVSIPAASPPPVSLGAGGLASLSLLPRPLRLHSVCWPLCPKTSLHPLPQLGPTETTQGLWPLGLGRSGSLGMECSARRLGQCLLGTPSVLRKALAREGESQVGRMSSQHGQQRFPALAFPLPISFFSVAH